MCYQFRLTLLQSPPVFWAMSRHQLHCSWCLLAFLCVLIQREGGIIFSYIHHTGMGGNISMISLPNCTTDVLSAELLTSCFAVFLFLVCTVCNAENWRRLIYETYKNMNFVFIFFLVVSLWPHVLGAYITAGRRWWLVSEKFWTKISVVLCWQSPLCCFPLYFLHWRRYAQPRDVLDHIVFPLKKSG